MRQLRNYKYIKEYFDAIEDGTIKVCREQYDLKDYLENRILNRDDVYIDEEAVENSIKIPESFFPYKLFLWQRFAQVFIYGLRWTKDNSLVFSEYFVYVGRGSGKNGWISWNSFYLSSGANGIKKYNIRINANSEEQAKTSFDDIYEVLEDKDEGQSIFKRTKEKITNRRTKSVIGFNTSNAKTKDGQRPGANIFDEVHAYENYDSISVATTGGGKVEDYREFYITTDGNVRGGPLDDMKDTALSILNGELGADKEGAGFSSMFPFIFKLDSPEEVDDPTNWEKATPSINFNPNLKKKMFEEYSKMQRNAQLRIEFMTKRMNQPLKDTRFELAEYEDVLKTQDEEMPEDVSEVIGAVDYAEIRDFCSVGLLARKSGKTYWKHFSFINKHALETQNINKTVIQMALEEKKAEIVHSKLIEPQRVVDWFVDKAKKYYIKQINMDEHRASILKPVFEQAGFKVNVVRRGRLTHSKLDPVITNMFIKHELFYGKDSLMRWYTMNVYKHFLPNDNVEYLKIEEETRKTDGFFAFTHAMNNWWDLSDYGEITVDDIDSFETLTF